MNDRPKPTRTASHAEDQVLEVLFNNDAAYRRKSSLIPAGTEGSRVEHHQNTPCFVHQHLKNRQKISIETPKLDKEPTSHGKGLHSRLLTKAQLADMTLGVRELSKQLGSVQLKLIVKTIFLLVKAHDESLMALSKELVDWLLSKDRETSYVVYVENTLKDNATFDANDLLSKDPSRQDRLKYWTTELCGTNPHTFDFAITLGGDGTLLYASWLFQNVVPPVLSFSLGSLGFLTRFDYAGFRETLTKAFRDGVTVSLRARFEGTVMRSQHKDHGNKHDLIEELIGEESENDLTHRPSGKFEILNDIVVDRGPYPTMSTIEVFGDSDHFTTVQADGVCIATPTGSTAYNLAAGGSLCHPENPVMLLTAICAHTLSFRPIILPDSIVLRLGVPYDSRSSSWASFDGRERVELHPGDYITICASRFPFANIVQSKSASDDWVNSISRTLSWNSRAKQKSFDDKPKQ